MKKMLLMVLSMIFVVSLNAENLWNVTWSMDQQPFQGVAAGSETNIVKAGFDTDGDGYGEFIHATSDLDSNFVTMFEATGDNTYEVVWSWKQPIPANSYYGIEVGDLDNNGIDEILISMPSVVEDDPTGTGDANPTRLWVFEWNGVSGENKYGDYTDDTFVAHAEWNFGVEDSSDFRPYTLIISDVDKDGSNELVTGVRQMNLAKNNYAKTRGINISSVSGTFSSGYAVFNTEYQLDTLGGGSVYDLSIGDLDGDGMLEVHIPLWDSWAMHNVECTGTNSYEYVSGIQAVYQPESWSEVYDHGSFGGTQVADVDGNGNFEYYYASTNVVDGKMLLYVLDGITDVATIDSSSITVLDSITTTASDGYSGIRSLQIGDPDGDGNMSLMFIQRYTGRAYEMEYKGSGTPTDKANWDLTLVFDLFAHAAEITGQTADSMETLLSPNFFYSTYAGDIDGDGKHEYIFANYSADLGDWDGDRYLWIIENGTYVNIDDNLVLAKEFSLKQNYPNPFNPSTTISFDLNTSDMISLVIYDITGKEVNTLVNKDMTAGNYTYNWNAVNNSGKKVASGIYFYTLKSSTSSITQKMMYLK